MFLGEIVIIFALFGKCITEISKVHIVAIGRLNLKNERAMQRESKVLFIRISLDPCFHLKNFERYQPLLLQNVKLELYFLRPKLSASRTKMTCFRFSFQESFPGSYTFRYAFDGPTCIKKVVAK